MEGDDPASTADSVEVSIGDYFYNVSLFYKDFVTPRPQSDLDGINGGASGGSSPPGRGGPSGPRWSAWQDRTWVGAKWRTHLGGG